MVAVAAGSVLAPRPLLHPFLIIGAVCAALPDIDAIGRPFYGEPGDLQSLGGHRGFTHSLAFAAALGVTLALATLQDSRWRGYRARFAIFIAFATAAHGALDALTSIGAKTSSVQFFSPFSVQGYTASWHPIQGPFSELFLCLIPLVLFTRSVWYKRRIPWPRRTQERPVVLELR